MELKKYLLHLVSGLLDGVFRSFEVQDPVLSGAGALQARHHACAAPHALDGGATGPYDVLHEVLGEFDAVGGHREFAACFTAGQCQRDKLFDVILRPRASGRITSKEDLAHALVRELSDGDRAAGLHHQLSNVLALRPDKVAHELVWNLDYFLSEVVFVILLHSETELGQFRSRRRSVSSSRGHLDIRGVFGLNATALQNWGRRRRRQRLQPLRGLVLAVRRGGGLLARGDEGLDLGRDVAGGGGGKGAQMSQFFLGQGHLPNSFPNTSYYNTYLIAE
mmetsp:Transcript_74151/g.154662  ORF Transcript_74151/g.154662 Transcript_74151/m.154662 type:complete len:278 (+) Transcript_74151:870-1703(+)